MSDLLRPCAHCGHAWNAHHFDTHASRAGIFCSRYSNGGDPCEKGCPGFKEVDRYAAYEKMTDYPEMISGPYADDATGGD